jgi:hypothetical protein
MLELVGTAAATAEAIDEFVGTAAAICVVVGPVAANPADVPAVTTAAATSEF